MPMRAAGLTAAKVRTAEPGRYGDGDGLYLLVRSPTSAFFRQAAEEFIANKKAEWRNATHASQWPSTLET